MDKRFTIGRTLAVAVGIYFRNFVSFAVLALIVYTPLFAYAIWGMNRAMNTDDLAAADDRGAVVVIVAISGTYLLSKVVAGAVAYGVFNQLRDTHVSLGACVVNGLKRVIPVLLTAILLAILIGVATATYILPGIVCTCLTYVAVPAAVIEGFGPFKAFARSVKLVDKDMPRVFVLLLVFVAVQFGCYWGLKDLLDAVAPHNPMVRISVILFATTLFGAFDAVLSSVAYAHLRSDRDGVGMSELAKVFD
jgi:hypothetical protein